MNYQDTIDFLFRQLPMYQRQGKKAFKKDLTNIRRLCSSLGDPQNEFRTIHIAGTNGKGTVSHILSAILQTSGLKCGLYTSPHYKDYRERIKIDGRYISKKEILRFVEKVKPKMEELQPSFFEITVAMAFWHFATREVDIAVIETGLGGRLDSTNIITPVLSVITNISYDHTDMLGDTLPAIAGEKAGIIKKNVPVLIGERQTEVQDVFIQKADETQSTLHFAQDLIQLSEKNGLLSAIDKRSKDQYEIKPSLKGPYALKNTTTALGAVAVLKDYDFDISNKVIKEALANVATISNYMGRWQELGSSPLIIADSAHNDAGLELAFSEVRNLNFDELHIVLGFVKDKDLEKALSHFPQEARYYFAKADISRGLDAGELKAHAKVHGLHGRSYVSVKNALKAAKRAASVEDLILVIGSIFVVAEVI